MEVRLEQTFRQMGIRSSSSSIEHWHVGYGITDYVAGVVILLKTAAYPRTPLSMPKPQSNAPR